MGNSGAKAGVKRNYANKNNTIKYCEGKIVQNFVLIWLDAKIDVNQKDCRYTISELNKIYNSISLFTDLEECRQFIEKPRDEQIFLIVSGTLGQQLIPSVHKYVRLDTIYVFCGSPERHKWTKEWRKIKLVTNQIEPICKSLVNDAAQCEEDLTPISVLSSNSCESQDLEQVDPSFMYSQILKEILMEMTNDPSAKQDFVQYCRDSYENNEEQLKIIVEFDKDYEKRSPIWWYTRESCVYRMLNRSLRTFDIDIITLMAFFMKDIHKQIKDIYSTTAKKTGSFVIYRGQGMLDEEFEKVRDNVGGLIAFNSFLSTTEKMDVAMQFAQKSSGRAGKTAMLFEIVYDPTVTFTPFALLQGVSYYGQKEGEILFSMHTIFRIVRIKPDQNGIYNIKLQSVSDSDLQITKLTNQLRSDIGEGNAIDRLGRLMIILGELEKAKLIYKLLRQSTSEENKRTLAWIHNQFGRIQYEQRKYDEARMSFENAVKIQTTLDSSNNLDLATMYSNMGLLYTALGQASTALSFHKDALQIRENNPKVNLVDLATTYNNIGLVYDKQGEFSSALSYYQKTLLIYEKTLSVNHPSLGTLYKNIGLAQVSMKRHTDALNNLLKARDIRIKALPPYHPSIASVSSAIGDVYKEIGDDNNALKYYEEALQIEERAPHINYSNLAMNYYLASKISRNLNNHDKAVKYAQCAVEVASQTKSVHDEDIAKYKKHLQQFQTE